MRNFLHLAGRALARSCIISKPTKQILRYSTIGMQERINSTQESEMHNKSFSDIVKYVNELKDEMNSTHPLFPLLIDESYPARTRMSFIPHMMCFSVGLADFLSCMLRVNKPKNELTHIEREVNTFINEDDFHYNYYIRDLEALGYTTEKFGSAANVIRHIWSYDCMGARKIVYDSCRALEFTKDPMIRLTLAEIYEAGLFELFTSIYGNIINGKNDLPKLEYFGDTHVNLEANHEVTAQFSNRDDQTGEKYAWKHEIVDEDVARACHRAAKEIMSSFELMYDNFYEVIQANHRGQDVIHPARFEENIDPPIRNIVKRLQNA